MESSAKTLAKVVLLNWVPEEALLAPADLVLLLDSIKLAFITAIHFGRISQFLNFKSALFVVNFSDRRGDSSNSAETKHLYPLLGTFQKRPDTGAAKPLARSGVIENWAPQYKGAKF